MVCYISAFFFTSIANVSFLYGTMPLVTLVLSVLVLRERPTAIAIACCVVCAIGVATMTGGAHSLGDRTGMLLAFGMTVSFAALTVAAKRFPDTDVMRATWLTGFMAAFATAPFASFSGVSAADYSWLVLYGLVNIGFGFGLYLLGAKRIPSIAAALIGLIEIPLAPVWAYLLFDETISWQTFAGGTIILLSTVNYLLGSSLSARIALHRQARDPLLP
jgi:drug/metabolite transporter (DMT)-like permease